MSEKCPVCKLAVAGSLLPIEACSCSGKTRKIFDPDVLRLGAPMGMSVAACMVPAVPDKTGVIPEEQLQPGQRIDVDNFSEDLPTRGNHNSIYQCPECGQHRCICDPHRKTYPAPQPGNIRPVITDEPIRKEVLKTDPLGEHKQLIVMVGLPYSGKSTAARDLSKIFNAPIVNPDSIRVALHGHKFIPEAEPHVWAIAKTMVRSLFLTGHDNVILDSTCVTEKRRKEWISYAAEWTVRYKYIHATLQQCVDRAVDHDDLVMIPIIKSMHEELTVPHTWHADVATKES